LGTCFQPTRLFTSNVFLSRKDQQKKLLYIHTSHSLRCLYTSSTLLFPSSRRQENTRNNKGALGKRRARRQTCNAAARLLLIIGQRRVVRLLLRHRRAEVGGVVAVVLASEGARVRTRTSPGRSSCWRATRWTTTPSCRPASTPPARRSLSVITGLLLSIAAPSLSHLNLTAERKFRRVHYIHAPKQRKKCYGRNRTADHPFKERQRR
jgi:hypothetical protein